MELIPAEVHQVIDGDTVDLDLSLGFGVVLRQRARLLGLNCPEKNTEAGRAASAFVRAWADGCNDQVLVEVCEKREKYGRLLVRLFPRDGVGCLNDRLLAEELAIPYDGAGPREGSTK